MARVLCELLQRRLADVRAALEGGLHLRARERAVAGGQGQGHRAVLQRLGHVTAASCSGERRRVDADLVADLPRGGAPVADRDRDHPLVGAGLHQRWKCNTFAARADRHQLAVGDAEGCRALGREAGVVVPDHLRDRVGELLQPGVVGERAVAQGHLLVEPQLEVGGGAQGAERERRGPGGVEGSGERRLGELDEAVAQRLAPERLEGGRRALGLREDLGLQPLAEQLVRRGRRGLLRPAQERVDRRARLEDRRERGLAHRQHAAARFGVAPRFGGRVVGGEVVAGAARLVGPVGDGDLELDPAQRGREALCLRVGLQRVDAREHQRAHLARLDLGDQLVISVVTGVEQGRAGDVHRVPDRSEQLVAERRQHLRGGLADARHHQALGPGLRQLRCQPVERLSCSRRLGQRGHRSQQRVPLRVRRPRAEPAHEACERGDQLTGRERHALVGVGPRQRERGLELPEAAVVAHGGRNGLRPFVASFVTSFGLALGAFGGRLDHTGSERELAPLGELPRERHRLHPGAEEVGREGGDHLRVVESITGHHVRAVERLVGRGERGELPRRVVPGHLETGPRRLQLAERRVEGRTALGAGQHAHALGIVRGLRLGEAREDRLVEVGPGGGLARRERSARAARIIKREHGGLPHRAEPALRHRVLGVALDLDRPPVARLVEHPALRGAAAAGRGVPVGGARRDLLGLGQVRHHLGDRRARAGGEAGGGGREAHHREEVAPRVVRWRAWLRLAERHEGAVCCHGLARRRPDRKLLGELALGERADLRVASPRCEALPVSAIALRHREWLRISGGRPRSRSAA